jgi:hypothetical protein
MTEQEAAKQCADLLRKIVRSIDKNLQYSLAGSSRQGQLDLSLSARGKSGVVSLRSDALKSALTNDASKNTIRQKIKSARDHLLSSYVSDVMGKKMARMLKDSKAASDANTSSYFAFRGGQRRR